MQTVLSHAAILQTQKRSEAEIPTQLSEFISLGWSEGSYCLGRIKDWDQGLLGVARAPNLVI